MEKLKYKKLLPVLLPLLIWLLVLILPFFSRVVNLPPEMRNGFLKTQLFTNSLLLIVFYVHTYLIYPLKERKYGLFVYLVLLLLCMTAYVLAHKYVMLRLLGFSPEQLFRPPGMRPPGKDWVFMPGPPMIGFPFVFVVMLSICYRLYTDKQARERLIEERERIHLKTELEFLSSQISPHFMFNVLNTMVAMARKKSEQLEASLIRLSQLMRYMLYDNDGAEICLESEVGYLKNYINLQLLRFGEDVKVNQYFIGSFEQYRIAPMLLIPFVENAFKHGTGTLEEPVIDVLMNITDDKPGHLHFMVMNGIAPKSFSAQERSSWIGLVNVRRRLQLLYPGKHSFSITQTNDTFVIDLKIDL